jgi:hypothetical protein
MTGSLSTGRKVKTTVGHFKDHYTGRISHHDPNLVILAPGDSLPGTMIIMKTGGSGSQTGVQNFEQHPGRRKDLPDNIKGASWPPFLVLLSLAFSEKIIAG